MSLSLLIQPVLSPASLTHISENPATVTRNLADTIDITVQDSLNSYLYVVEKTNWTLVGLQISGDIYYDVRYVWEIRNRLPVLKTIGLFRNVDLSTGGYSFSNIRINGNAVLDVNPSLYHSISRSVPYQRDRSSVFFSLRGRRLSLSQSIDGIAPPTFAAGVYLGPSGTRGRPVKRFFSTTPGR